MASTLLEEVACSRDRAENWSAKCGQVLRPVNGDLNLSGVVRGPDTNERAGSLKFGVQVRGLEGYRDTDKSEPNRQRSGSRGQGIRDWAF